MEDRKLTLDSSFEPLQTHRFLISSIGVEIPSPLFRKYKLFNEGDELIFTTKFMETIQFVFDPNDFFNITGFKIEFLDPVGITVKTMVFDVKGSNFVKKDNYADNGKLSGYDMRFIVNKNSLKLV